MVVRRLTFLLRPGWIILALVVVAFAYLCFNVLAPWQLGKNVRTSHRNQLISDSVKAQPVPIQQLIGPGRDGAAADDEWRRVTATGHYLPDSTVLVRLRSYEDSPAYEVLAVFQLEDGRDLLIDRGYVKPIGEVDPKPPAVDSTTPPAGPVTVEARIRKSEGILPGKNPITQDGYRQVHTVDSGQVGTVLDLPLTRGYLQLESNQPGSFIPIGLPQLDAGPYLSYGLQWLAFGLMAPLGLAYFVRAELRERRKEREARTTADTPTPQTAADNSPEPVRIEPETKRVEAKLADRYGRR